MDLETAYTLNQLNARFYEHNAQSFSRTRQRAWDGWNRVLDKVGEPSSVLDIAAGNSRFQRYVNERCVQRPIAHYCVDSCEELISESVEVRFQKLDVIECVLSGNLLSEAIQAPACDLCTTFGFMHHVPGKHAQMRVLDALLEKTLPKGHIAISFWQFAKEPKRAEKAAKTTTQAMRVLGLDIDLEPGDYLIGWNDRAGQYRYCHSFSDDEIQELVGYASPYAKLVDSFSADGQNGKANAYVVLERNHAS